MEKVSELHRFPSRKRFPSRNWFRAEIELARAHEHLGNSREDL
ncbi:hypothetical protein [Sulfodiicoccus acidiphilus]|nr:hypothetical protein [Sulfodiicoccus acidiphilus]